jgi:hypothetical protein
VNEARIRLEPALVRKISSEWFMMLISSNESSFASVLVNGRIAEMNPWQSDNWLLEGADDGRQREPNTRREFRKRLLLHIGDQKWHLSQVECLKPGIQCRSLLEIR